MTDLTPIIKNFGYIKNVYNNLLAENVMSKDKNTKKNFQKYVKSIKENEILKTQFLVYTNIETKIESDFNKASMFVKENIDLFNKFNKKDIFECNKQLVLDLLFEQVVDDERKELHESISTLIFTDRTPNTIDAIVEAMNTVVNYIINNKPTVIAEAIELPNSLIASMMVDKYNERYSSLEESERKILKVFIESSEEENIQVYKDMLSECITLINENLNTDDLKVKEKLLKIKEKLLNDSQVISEDYIKNITKLIELKDVLKN